MLKHMGLLIMKLRIKEGMTRSALAEGICSEKFVYLIEKGERMPSAEVLKMFGNRLGANLWDYFEYMDCTEPFEVHRIIKNFTSCRNSNNFGKLKILTDEAAKLKDFRKKPYYYELNVNRIAVSLFYDHQPEEAEKKLTEILSQMEACYLNEEFTANMYIMLSTCLQIRGDITGAEEATLKAENIVERKMSLYNYYRITISVKLNKMTIDHLTGNWDNAVETGKWLLQYQNNANFYERTEYIYFYLAYSYYNKGEKTEAFACLEKCLYILLINYTPVSAYYITNYDMFENILDESGINPELIGKMKEKYNFNR